MDSQIIFAQFRDPFAARYPDEQDARVVVAGAGVDTKQIAFSPRVQTNWNNILVAALRQQRLDSLLNAALATHSDDTTLQAARTQYRLLVNGGGQLEPPDQLPAGADTVQTIATSGGAYVAGAVNLSRGDFVGRDRITVGDISQSVGVAVGSGATATVTIAEETAYNVQGLANPYLGLRSFTYDDRAIYAGRDPGHLALPR